MYHITRQTTPDDPTKYAGWYSKVSSEPVQMLHFTRMASIAPHFLPNHCHLNVLVTMHRYGGSKVNGWILWVGSIIELEFHSVWRDPDGFLHDVTPRADGESHIAFLPDPKTKVRLYPGQVAVYRNIIFPSVAYQTGRLPFTNAVPFIGQYGIEPSFLTNITGEYVS